MPEPMIVVHRTCPGCGRDNESHVRKAGYDAWLGGALIQNAFPELSAAEREALMTGYHDSCWKRLFREES